MKEINDKIMQIIYNFMFFLQNFVVFIKFLLFSKCNFFTEIIYFFVFFLILFYLLFSDLLTSAIFCKEGAAIKTT